ncbi:MAG: hypothetical protein HYX34_04235 [Actinobacteria bacterium]|nr:hypothetical protein [Actinomycetota bacterium]
MPEGDTLHRIAARLEPVLAGAALTRFEAPRLLGARPSPGTTIEHVEAVGKHLLIHFAGGLTLRTHLRMTGSWHLYREGERWRKPGHLVRARLDVPGWTAVCFSAPVVETYRRDHVGGPLGTGRDPVGHLGPDLCRVGLTDADLDECVRRLAATGPAGTEIADALLDQRVACGVGNVYKSEVCWACRLDPFTPVAGVPDDLQADLIRTAHRLLVANLRTARRTTVGPAGRGGVAVYGRAGQPCSRCGAPVRMRRQGQHARTTYWCPGCQVRPRGSAGAATRQG